MKETIQSEIAAWRENLAQLDQNLAKHEQELLQMRRMRIAHNAAIAALERVLEKAEAPVEAKPAE
jgi:chromosome segregation ATPase